METDLSTFELNRVRNFCPIQSLYYVLILTFLLLFFHISHISYYGMTFHTSPVINFNDLITPTVSTVDFR